MVFLSSPSLAINPQIYLILIMHKNQTNISYSIYRHFGDCLMKSHGFILAKNINIKLPALFSQ